MGPSSVLELPLLPLRDVVVYPHMVLPLFVGREKSIEALEDAMSSDKQVLLVAQRNAAEDNPSADDMYQVGTVSNILQLLKLPDGTIKVLVEGVCTETEHLLQGRHRGMAPEIDGRVLINDGRAPSGEIVEVEITEGYADDLVGRIVGPSNRPGVEPAVA